MRHLLLCTAIYGLVGCATAVKPVKEETVRVIASLNTCYEISMRHSETIAKIRFDSDYQRIAIPTDLIPVYREQQHLVRSVPWNCDLWLNNPDFVDEATLLLK